MKRNAKSLQQKAKNHTVDPSTSGIFAVTSASSGREYNVRSHADGSFSCTCDYGLIYWRSRRPCSHILAVMDWLAEAGDRRQSYWASREDADRQRKQTERVGPNLWATSRRLKTRESLRVTAATAMDELFD